LKLSTSIAQVARDLVFFVLQSSISFARFSGELRSVPGSKKARPRAWAKAGVTCVATNRATRAEIIIFFITVS